MKLVSFLLIAFLAFSCGSNSSNESIDINNKINTIDSTYCDCSELTFDQPYNHYWRFEKRKGFTGKCESFYADSTVKETRNFVDGKLHGKVVTYYDNGQIEDEKEFDMNFQTGEQITYTKKGEVKFHALYKRGQQQQILVNKPKLLKEDPWEN